VGAEGTILGHLGASPGHCEVQGIAGVRQSYSVGGSSDAAVRCQYSSNLLKVILHNTACAGLKRVRFPCHICSKHQQFDTDFVVETKLQAWNLV